VNLEPSLSNVVLEITREKTGALECVLWRRRHLGYAEDRGIQAAIRNVGKRVAIARLCQLGSEEAFRL
jgi:hypothetical protein